MLIVGLTGGIASGKSTVSHLLSETHKVPLIDLDTLARAVVEPGTPALKAIVKHFGDKILKEDGTLDRPALGRIVFNDAEQRKVLNRITHSAVRKRMAWTILLLWIKGTKVVVVDAPLLVEAGLWAYCGEIVVVWCSPQDQLNRMLSRDGATGLTEEDARSRLASQLPLEDKLPYADVILDNSSALASSDPSAPGSSSDPSTSPAGKAARSSDALRAQVAELVQRWKSNTSSLGGWCMWLLEWVIPPFGLVAGFLAVMKRREAIAHKRLNAEAAKKARGKAQALEGQGTETKKTA
ncbi:Dephospho-CoA kinase cab5 [Tilletia horrida]|nr:Dephospho-CoA kinase cab5 [Tilletia horrida]